MAAGLIQAGSRITASLLQSIAPLCVVKGADESVTSSTTLQNDNELFLPVVASAIYIFGCYLDFEGGTAGSSDINWDWSLPTGATLRYQPVFAAASSGLPTSVGTTITGTTQQAAGTNAAGVLRGCQMDGSLVMSSTAGTLQLKWAQNTSSATPTIVHAQSYVTLWRIS